MQDSSVVLIGSVATDVREYTGGDFTRIQFRLAVNERRFDRESDRWVDADTSFYTVVAWRDLASNASISIRKGDPVVVTGRMRVREWTTDEGKRGMSTEITATSIGHDLARGTTEFTRVIRARPNPALISAA